VLPVPLPLVAIVGAPNVGKSTLFNRLVGRRQAIVTDEPGVTRDRLYGVVHDAAPPFRIADTGGLTPASSAPYAREIERQAAAALDEAAAALLVVDARAGATAVDQDLAAMLRRRGIPCVLVANKVDSERVEAGIHELHALGLGEPLAVSAEHGSGIGELLDRLEPIVAAAQPDAPAAAEGESGPRVAIVGRPNVGKSSIFNRLAGAERAVVSEIPGTTRDAIDTVVEIGSRRYVVIDTAGLRRPGRRDAGVERHSAQRTRANIERCDVAVVVLDATSELTAMDAHIAGYVLEAFKPMVVAVNKWDLVLDREDQAREWEERVRQRLRFAKQVPLVLISARTGQRVAAILDRVDAVHAASGIEVPTAELNRWLQTHPAATPAARPVPGVFRLFYATQTGTHPPSFVLFCNDPARAHFSLRRQLENGLRETFGFGPTPLRLRFRARREARHT
jgi:GTP-binding protein